MKKIILLLFFFPFLSKSQGIKIIKVDNAFYDTKFNKIVHDSVYAANGWLDAGNNDKADTRYPYLQFTITKSKIKGFYIEVDGNFIGESYISTSEIDSVEIELENHDKIKLNCRENYLANNSVSTITQVKEYIYLSENNINKLKALSVYKFSFFSSKYGKPNVKGEILVREKYKNQILDCLNALIQ